jgi:hypothetical protein
MVAKRFFFVSAGILSLVLAPALPINSSAQRRTSPEAQVFRQYRSGVATVFNDEGHGSGFLVDTLGLLITNDHVAGGSSRLTVKFDDSTRVVAELLASNPRADVAVIRVNPLIAARYPKLVLAIPSDSMVMEGDRVIAIGSPLNQEKIMTAGIISKVEPTAVISDVNINHGNSGGPLLNLDGLVVAINTFGDFTTQGGPGVSGSILINQALPVLESARASAAGRLPPSPELLAVAPRRPFPLDTLQATAASEDFDSKPYFVSDRVGTGKFVVVAVTPVFDAWRSHRYEMELAKATVKREKKGGVPAPQGTDPGRGMKEWMRYTGSSYVPVVSFEFTPKIGETAGSVVGNIFGSALAGASYRGSHRMEFKADFKDVRITRDSVEIEDVGRFRGLQPLVFSKSTWTADYFAADQARIGVFQCTSEWFHPDGGRWPTIEIAVTSVEKPNSPYAFTIPLETVKRLWCDFEAYREVDGIHDSLSVCDNVKSTSRQSPSKGWGISDPNQKK